MRSGLALVCILSLTALANAGGPETDADKADHLFQEAQQLKEAGKTADACAKFQEALRYNKNAVGTLLNVGKCAEDDGKVATAVKLFTQARDLARENNLAEHRKAAEDRIAVDAPKVPRLAIAFMERAENMKLVIDDEVVPTDVESTSELRLDPGQRHIVVTAPGRLPFDTTVTLTEGKQSAVAIPKLGYPVTVKHTRRTLGLGFGIAGVAALGTGIVIGFVAHGQYEKQFDVDPNTGVAPCSKPADGGKPLCDPTGYGKTQSAHQLGNVGTGVAIVGGVAIAAGVILFITSRKEGSQEVAVVPSIDRDGAGLAAVGHF